MALILKKLKGKPVEREAEHAGWNHVFFLIKIIVILFVIFSSFHWIVKKRIQHLPAQGWPKAMSVTRQSFAPNIYTVQSGDTLWKIAVRHYPKENPLVIIRKIKELNGLLKDNIRVGKTLKLP